MRSQTTQTGKADEMLKPNDIAMFTGIFGDPTVKILRITPKRRTVVAEIRHTFSTNGNEVYAGSIIRGREHEFVLFHR